MKPFLLVLFVLLIQCVHADEWEFKAGKEEFKFNEVKIVQIIESETEYSSYPDFILEFYVKGKLQAKYRNVHCDAIFQTPNKEYFVGLSNRGVPGTAYIILDRSGNLIREVRHDFFDFVEYCCCSIKINRTWVNIEKPDIKIYPTMGGQVIEVAGCNGKRYNLLNGGFYVDGKFYYDEAGSLDNKYNNIIQFESHENEKKKNNQ